MLRFWALALATLASVDSLQAPFRFRRDAPSNSITNKRWNATKEDKLKQELLQNYDKFTRPSNNGTATLVHFDPAIYHYEVDEGKSIMTIHCWVKMGWNDDKLRWNESDHEGLTELHIADHEIWQPDVVPYNSASSVGDQYGDVNMIVYSTGRVLWVPPAILHVFCDLDLTKWPFDTQTCMMKVGSWTYSGVQIDLNYSDADPRSENVLENAEWKFISMERQRNTVKYACCKEPYIDLMFNVTIQRQTQTYKALIVAPITAIVLMTLATFWLPAASSDKLYLGGSTSIVIALFLVYFTRKLSITAGHTPLIVKFYSSSFYLVALSVVISVITLNLASGSKSRPVPWILKSQLSGWLGYILLLRNYNSQTSGKSMSEDTADSRPVFAESQDSPEGQEQTSSVRSTQSDWHLLATAIDRIFFLIYCFLFVCFTLAYIA